MLRKHLILLFAVLVLAAPLGPGFDVRAQTTPADIVREALTPGTGTGEQSGEQAPPDASAPEDGQADAAEDGQEAPPAAGADAETRTGDEQAAAVVDPAVGAALEKAQARVDAWSAELDQVEATLQRQTVSTATLDSLRATVAEIRTASEEVQASLQPRAKALERRVSELAPPEEKEGETQPDPVSRQLEVQRQQLAAVNGVLKQIQVTQLRTDEIQGRIAQLRREQLTRRLLTPTPSVLEPSFWTQVARDLNPTVRAGQLLISDWVGLIYARAGAWAVGLVLIALIGTYGLVWPLRKLLLDRAARDPDVSPAPLRRSTAALAIALLATVVPAAAMIIFYRGLDVFDLAPDRIRLVLTAIFRGLVFASFAQGMAWALIAPTRANWRLLPLNDDAATKLMRLATIAGATFALSLVVTGIADVLSSPSDLILAVQAVVALIIGALTVAALRAVARSTDSESENFEGGISAIGRWLLPLFWIAALAALLAPVVGYIRFGSFVAQQIVWSVSVFGVLHLLLMVIDDVATGLFRPDTPLGRTLRESMGIGSGAIEQIGVLLSGILRILLIVIAAISVLAPWGVSTGDVTGLLRQALFGFQIGSFTFSLSQIVLALVIFIIGLTITRAMQRWLEARYLPHTKLDVGLKSSIRTGFGYVGVIIASVIAFSYLGLNLQNIAIVAGALSVGIGFGLQSIVNNFVSGLILLAERPIKVGDWIVVGSEEGYVRRINVRATEVETFDRQTVIVPNSDLISGVVKNWMHDDSSGRIILGVGVSYDTDPELVRDILMSIARDNSQLLAYPAPVVYFMDFGESSLDFELRAYLSQIDYALVVKSQLRFEIMRRFREAGIEIPYPQRDLNLRDMERLEAALSRGADRPAPVAPPAPPARPRAADPADGDSE